MSTKPLWFEERIPPATDVRPRRSWSRGLLIVLLLFLVTRLAAWIGAYMGAAVVFCIRQHWEPPLARYLNQYRQQPPDPNSPEYRSALELLGDFAPLAQFDGLNYKSVIERGYEYRPPPDDAQPYQFQQNIAFFPLYPGVCRLLAGWMSAQAAMILVSHVAVLAAVILLYLWLRARTDEPVALFAVAAVLCWPAACYYSFAYAESLTLLLVIAALWLMDKRHFVWAAVASGLATATRPTAAGIAVVLLLAYWLREPGPRARRLAHLVPLALLGAAGILGYGVYLTWQFGSPTVYWQNYAAGWVPEGTRADWLEFLTLAPVWSRLGRLAAPVVAFPVGLIELANPLVWNIPLSLFLLVLSLVAVRRVPRSFRPLLLLGPLIFVQSYLASGGSSFGIDPMARYIGVAVPAFVVLAAWATRYWSAGLRGALLALMVLLQAAWAFRFGLREWSG